MENERPTTSDHVRQNIRNLRTEQGLRLADLSEMLKEQGHPLELNTLSRVEQGKRAIDVDDLVAFARALDVSPARMLDDPEAVGLQQALLLVNDWLSYLHAAGDALSMAAEVESRIRASDWANAVWDQIDPLLALKLELGQQMAESLSEQLGASDAPGSE